MICLIIMLLKLAKPMKIYLIQQLLYFKTAQTKRNQFIQRIGMDSKKEGIQLQKLQKETK